MLKRFPDLYMSMMHDTRGELNAAISKQIANRITQVSSSFLSVLLSEQVLDGDHIRLGVVRKAVLGGLVGAAAACVTHNGREKGRMLE
jgi:hypothetical protein